MIMNSNTATRQPIPIFFASVFLFGVGPGIGAGETANVVPQFAQNLALWEFANPQFGQFIFGEVEAAQRPILTFYRPQEYHIPVGPYHY